MKIALIIDTHGWAFYNIASQIMHHLEGDFEFSVISMSAANHNIADMLLACEDCDLVYIFWRQIINLLESKHVQKDFKRKGLDLKKFLELTKFATCVYDHLYLDKNSIHAHKPIFDSVVAYGVSSQKLYDIYERIEGYPSPTAILSDGVDLTLFQPRNLERLASRPPVIGWVGNSAWAGAGKDYKGVRTILKPVLQNMKLPSRLADRQESYIPHQKMIDYYASIDILVCTSEIEGTPNPVLEAMACGVPVISTDVGIVPEAFGPLQKQFILKERSQEALREALQTLLDTPSLLRQLSQENLVSIRPWSWALKAQAYGDFFKKLACSR